MPMFAVAMNSRAKVSPNRKFGELEFFWEEREAGFLSADTKLVSSAPLPVVRGVGLDGYLYLRSIKNLLPKIGNWEHNSANLGAARS